MNNETNELEQQIAFVVEWNYCKFVVWKIYSNFTQRKIFSSVRYKPK